MFELFLLYLLRALKNIDSEDGLSAESKAGVMIIDGG